MYDRRERAQNEYLWGLEGARREALQEGIEKGREEGLEKGQVIGTIATLQGIVGEPVVDSVELKKLDIDELNRMCADLQQRLRSRGNS